MPQTRPYSRTTVRSLDMRPSFAASFGLVLGLFLGCALTIVVALS